MPKMPRMRSRPQGSHAYRRSIRRRSLRFDAFMFVAEHPARELTPARRASPLRLHRRQKLAGIEDAFRIERRLDAPHERKRGGVDRELHEVALGETDAVFARERAVEANHGREYLAQALVRACELAVVA